MVWAFGAIIPMFIAAILWVASDLFGLFMPSDVGNIAHLSGIAIGIIAGIILRIRDKDKFRKVKAQRIEIPENYIKTGKRYI